LSEVGADVAAWARAHKACFEVAPLFEMVKGRKAQVGFTVSLYASLPIGKGPGEERRADAGKVWEGLREVLQTLVPKEEGRARIEIEAPRTAAFFRPENEMKPEIALSARVFHGDDYFAEVSPEEREGLSAVTKRLTDMGLKQGHW
jgi:hypothetical protein